MKLFIAGGLLYRRESRLRFAALGLILGLTLSVPPAAFGQAFPSSVISLENKKPGTTSWLLTSPATNQEIEGYASLTSVNRGGQINFLVNTTNSSYILEVFRMGWYQGTGAREVFGPVTVPGYVQAIPVPDPVTRLVECNWTNPYTLSIPATGDPTDWASGVYLAKLTGGQDGKQSYIIFVVRDDSRPTDLLAQVSFTTYQAYNNWGGASLYGYNSVPFPAKKVSFNRPYALKPGYVASYWMGTGEFFYLQSIGPAFECNMVRWLEREGYDVSYCGNLDTHSTTNLLWNHKGFISMGHDEYWSYPMRWNVQAARDRGVNLAFLSSGAIFWQVRFEPSTVDGASDRNMVCYKSLADPVYGTSSNLFTTVPFRSSPLNDLESSLLGVSYDLAGPEGDLVVGDSNHWVFANTGLTAGQQLPGLLGPEVDSTNKFSPTNVQVACATPYTWTGTYGTNNPIGYYSHAASYTAPSGATVFASGSMQWSWGLDDFNFPAGRSLYQNPAVQHITRNILARLANAPAPSPTLFFGTDVHTIGTWKPHYGTDGYLLPNDSTNLPAYASLNVSGATMTTYLAYSPSFNSLRHAASIGSYLAGWSSPTNFTIDLNLTDQKNHQVAFYFWDWNSAGRVQLVELLDGATTNVLDQRTIGSFTNGQWWAWQINGHVRFRFTKLTGPDCMANALAFGNGASAVFLGEDSLTQGNWRSRYGADGEYVAGDTPHDAAYGSMSIARPLITWSTSTMDPRGLQRSGSTNRIFAYWRGSWVAEYYLEIKDNAWHQLAVYCVDGDLQGRKQRVALFDQSTHAMLDSRELTNFGGGKYLVWNFRGAVVVRVLNFGPATSAVSGVFLDPTNHPPNVTLTSPADLQVFNLPTNIVLTADVAGASGSINQVSFFADGLLLGSATNAPFTFTWTNATAGHHQLTAMVQVNNLTQTVSSDPVGMLVNPPANYQPPVALITSPADGSVYQLPTNVTLTASVTFTSAPVVTVQFLVDGTPYGQPCTNGEFTLNTTKFPDGMHSIRATVTDSFGVMVTSPSVLVTVIGPVASAVFRKYDFGPRGTWSGLYGSDGYVIINKTTNLPPYAAINPLGNESSVLASSTFDPRALQNPATGGTVRFAGIWYSSTNFLLDVNLLDDDAHRIELYCLDWFNQGGSQTIQVLDAATGNVLDARTLNNYTNGAYLVWDISGRVRFAFSRNSTNAPALLTGIFIDPPRILPEVTLSKPANGTYFAVPTNILIQAYAFNGTNSLAFVKFYTNGIFLGFGDGGVPQTFLWANPPPGVYALTARAVETDGSSVLSAPVSITVEATATSAAASFVMSDTNHQGNWAGSFGQEGYLVAGGGTNLPAYVALKTGAQFITWSSYTTETRALQRDAGGSRVAAAFYSYTNVNFDVKFTDSIFHRVALYFLDWYNLFGVETVDVLDKVSGAVLDHQVLQPFANGVFDAWDVKGHVEFRITRTALWPAVVSGVFFDASGFLPAITITNPVTGTFFVAPTNIVITADAFADPNNVTHVDFYDGATLLGTVSNGPPYTFIWTNAPYGSHSLFAHEVGHVSAADSALVLACVVDSSGRLPAVTITNPIAGTIFIAPANITIIANATADPANVTRLDFYDGSTLLGTVSNNPPYTFVWTNAPPGGHSLTAHETGLTGTADSAPIPISIYEVHSNTLNFIGIKLLADGTAKLDALVPTGRLLRLEASASLSGGAVWLPLITNTSSDNLFHFIDTQPTNYPQRFYRIIALP